MVISKYNSSKITILNTILILMVLYIHSYYNEAEQYAGALAIQRFFSGNAFCGTANRLFFVMSGMLFFNGINNISDCFLKQRKRVKTILVPYLIWNVIFVCWYLVLKIIPGVGSFVNNDILANFDTFWHGVNFLFIEPASFPLWFLRDLICFVALSPLIYYFLKYMKFWGVLAYFVLGFFVPTYGFWFILGGCISMNCDLERFERFLSSPIFIISTVIFLIGCLYISLQPIEYRVPSILDSTMAFTGLIMTWRGYDYIAKKRCIAKESFCSSIMGYSFFIYLFHEPVFNIIKKIPIRLLGDLEPIVIIFFLINPIIICAVAICVAKCLQKVMPKMYSVLVGGR